MKTIKNWIGFWETRACEDRWETYVVGRQMKRYKAGKNEERYKLPPALAEGWGKKSLSYYKGLTRAQSTMLLHCRSEFIGLGYHLARIKAKDEKAAVCACHRGRVTPFHLFVECSMLAVARQSLFRQVEHTNYAKLCTTDGRIAAEWAISYFDIEQFDSVRERSSRFPPIPGINSTHPNKGPQQTSTTITRLSAPDPVVPSPGGMYIFGTNRTAGGISNNSTPPSPTGGQPKSLREKKTPVPYKLRQARKTTPYDI
ncbi:hypothetical protein ACHAO9_004821 [Fusarium lateritium]